MDDEDIGSFDIVMALDAFIERPPLGILPVLKAARREIVRLRAELEMVTEGRWTQTEIDACKWRGHELAEKLRTYD